jgi:pyruvate kinase
MRSDNASPRSRKVIMRRTKIVGTLGPSSDSEERIRELVEAGLDVARLNFSHGSHADHAARIQRIRRVAAAVGKPVAILQDLQGPKIRTGPLVDKQPVELKAGGTFAISIEQFAGTAARVSTTYTQLPQDVEPGDRILLSDGLIELRVSEVQPTEVITTVVHGGSLREHQGINLPGSAVSTDAITEKDREDLKFGLEQGVDYVAMSFVRRAEDVRQLKRLIADAGKSTPVVAKIEKPQALRKIEAILHETDVVMVARGDLGVEMAPEQVPIVQKDLIKATLTHNVAVITATQMLESMISNPRPTRAEASDVANAIFDGTDAVMLSAETAAGQYPIQAVQMMARIALATEASPGYRQRLEEGRQWDLEMSGNSSLAIAHAAYTIAETVQLAAVVAFTQSGYTARLVSKSRLPVPVFALTPSEEIARRVSLYWGVTPVICPRLDMLNKLDDWVREALPAYGIAPGSRVAVTGGHPLGEFGPTNFIKILEI